MAGRPGPRETLRVARNLERRVFSSSISSRPFHQFHIWYHHLQSQASIIQAKAEAPEGEVQPRLHHHTQALMMNMPVSNPFGQAVASRQDEARSLDRPAARRHEVEASGIPSHENPNRVTLQPASQTQNVISHNLPSAAACPEQSGPVFDRIATDGHLSPAAGPNQINTSAS